MKLPVLKGNTALLADYLLKTFTKQRWTVNLIMDIRDNITMGRMKEADAVDYYKEAIINGGVLKFIFIKEDTVDWNALYEYSDKFCSRDNADE